MPVTGTGTGCYLPRIAGTGGPRSWSSTTNAQAVREYKLKYRVECEPGMGPAGVRFTPGLPLPGDTWAPIDDLDIYAFCTPQLTVEPVEVEGSPNAYFDLTYTFSTDTADQCYAGYSDNPLLRANKVSGSFHRYTKPATTDRFGVSIKNSAFERITGPQVEFDESRPSIRVEQNVATLDLDIISALMDGVNAFTMWGFPPRTIKLSGCSWERRWFYDCGCYFTRVLEFDINTDTFDRQILDEGTKALHGKWNEERGHWEILPIGIDPGSLEPIMPDPDNPNHYVRFQDRNGNVTRVVLNGNGKPYDPFMVTTGTDDDVEGYITVEKYNSVDFSVLDLPVSLEC